MNTYNRPAQYNEHKDRHNNLYFNMLLEGGEVIPAYDDYSEDSFPNSKRRNDYDSGCYREGIQSIKPTR